MTPDYVEPLNNYKVDINRLVEEYKSVENLMQDRRRPGTKVLIQKALNLVQDRIDLDVIKSLPYTLQTVTHLRTIYISGNTSVVYRCVLPYTCYRWHTDLPRSQFTIHIPLITNEGCKFVYDDRAFYMPADGTVYVVNTNRYHSFMNGGDSPRVHITIESYSTPPVR